MHVYNIYLPVMNLGAPVTIVSVTISEVAAHHQGPHQNRSPMLGPDGSMAFFGLSQYSVIEAEDFALTILQE